MMARRFLIVFLVAFLIGFVIGTAIRLSAQAPTAQQSIAQTLRDLAACQAQLAPGTRLQAELVAGNLVDWPTVKKSIEAANPAQVLDLSTKKLSPKPEKESAK